MSSQESEIVWLYEPNALINREYIFNLWPKNDNSLASNINAVTRTIVLLTLFGIFVIKHKPFKLLITSSIALVVLMAYYKKLEKENTTSTESQEGFIPTLPSEEEYIQNKNISDNRDKRFTEPSKENPFGNVMPKDIKENPERKQAAPSYYDEVNKDIKKAVKENLDPKLFRDLGDDFSFDDSQRQFMTMPNTTIPNNQKGFAEFCYGNMASDKENTLETY